MLERRREDGILDVTLQKGDDELKMHTVNNWDYVAVHSKRGLNFCEAFMTKIDFIDWCQHCIKELDES